MDIRTRIFLIVGSLVFFAFLLSVIKKSKISIDMATMWILFALVMVIIAIFPEIVYWFSFQIGIQSPTNAIYLVMFALLLVLVFYLFMKISILENKLNRLIEKIAIENKKNEK